MAEQSGFFPDVSGDRTYTADFLARWISSIISNGVYNGDLAVTAGNNMQIRVPSGKAWINGYYYRNDGDMTLAIANADGVLNRKDTVVLRWDVNARSITAQVLQGTAASSPVTPALTHTTEQYDLKLAEISIPAGTTAITQSLITDTRLDKTVCGIVTGVVQQVDTTTLYNQIAADLAEFKSKNEAGFTAWFEAIKSILDENATGHLQTEIEAITNSKAQPNGIATLDANGNLVQMPNAQQINAVASLPVGTLTNAQLNDATIPYDYETEIDGTTAKTIGLPVTDASWYFISYRAHGSGGYPRQTASNANGTEITFSRIGQGTSTFRPWQVTAGNNKTWYATAVQGAYSDQYALTIPNFVFSEGCQIVFKAPSNASSGTNLDWWRILINGGNEYSIRTLSRAAVDSDAWSMNAMLTVQLSSEVIQLNMSGDGTNGTAFFKSGVSVKEPFDFYLAMQTATPTFTTTNGIWIQNDAKMSLVIDEAIRASDWAGVNLYYAIVDNTDNNYMHLEVPKKTVDGAAVSVIDRHINKDAVPLHLGNTIFAQKYGMNFYTDDYIKWPRIYSRINGVVDIENALRWDGSNWQWLSQKGKYIFENVPYQNLQFAYNRAGATLSPHSAICSLSTPYDTCSSLDGNYVVFTNNSRGGVYLYARNGDGFNYVTITGISTIVVCSAALSSDGTYLAVLAPGTSSGSNDGYLTVFKKQANGTYAYLANVATGFYNFRSVRFTTDDNFLFVTDMNGKNIIIYKRSGDSFSWSQTLAVSGYPTTITTTSVSSGFVTIYNRGGGPGTPMCYDVFLNAGVWSVANMGSNSSTAYAPDFNAGNTAICGWWAITITDDLYQQHQNSYYSSKINDVSQFHSGVLRTGKEYNCGIYGTSDGYLYAQNVTDGTLDIFAVNQSDGSATYVSSINNGFLSSASHISIGGIG